MESVDAPQDSASFYEHLYATAGIRQTGNGPTKVNGDDSPGSY
jgi:hypothetical protein